MIKGLRRMLGLSLFFIVIMALILRVQAMWFWVGLLVLDVVLLCLHWHARGERFIRMVSHGGMIPRFYGVAWCGVNSPIAYCAPVPFNLLIGLSRSLWFWMKHGWRNMSLSTHAAYAQGRKDVIKELLIVFARKDLNSMR